MKLLENGRLFGRVSLVTLAIAIVLLALLFNAARVFYLQELHKETAWITVWAEARAAPPELAELLSPGEKVFLQGQKIAEILEVHAFDSANFPRKDIVLKGKFLTTVEEDGYLFRYTYLKEGQVLDFQTEQHAFSGQIIAIGEEAPFEEVTKVIELELDQDYALLSHLIQAGEKKTDLRGTMLANVLGKRIEPFPIVSWDANGTPIASESPIEEKVIVQVELRAIKRAGELFFGNDKLNLLDRFSIEFDGVSLAGQIISIE